MSWWLIAQLSVLAGDYTAGVGEALVAVATPREVDYRRLFRSATPAKVSIIRVVTKPPSFTRQSITVADIMTTGSCTGECHSARKCPTTAEFMHRMEPVVESQGRHPFLSVVDEGGSGGAAGDDREPRVPEIEELIEHSADDVAFSQKTALLNVKVQT